MATSAKPIADPVCLRDTAQEFMGVVYYRCGAYFQRKGVRLHRVVWEAHNGPIPDGWHVHHRDGDRAENGIANLQLLRAADHSRHHHAGKHRSVPARTLAAATEWHGSAAGAEWHSRQWHAYMGPLMAGRVTKSCEVCGGQFEARSIFAARSRFCHPNCKAVALRRRRAAERAQGRVLPADQAGVAGG